MIKRRLCFPATWVCAALFCLVFSARAEAPILDLEVRLIWASNDPKSPNPDHKSLDTKLTKWLGTKFKWKYYFEVKRQVAAIPLNESRKINMSKTCDLEVKNLGDSRIDVKFFGAGKPVNKMVHSLPKGDWLVIAGDDKNDTAWFVVLRTAPPEK
jgi:hypothetical protein